MSREVRMVAPGWEHPKYPADYYEPHRRGRYIPLFDGGFATADTEWDEGYAKWQAGFVKGWGADEGWIARTAEHGPTYTNWHGARPSPDDYMPDWPASERTMLMMYETTSEGTPISPAFTTSEELARWLADNGASAFAGETASYEAWLRVCRGGYAPSAVMQNGVMESGVAALSK